MSRLGQSRIHAITPVPVRTPGRSGIGAGTLVLTLDGEIPVDHLVPGDRLITRAGARTLARIASHVTRGAFRVSPHALGHDRPEGWVDLGPGQELFLRDWRARAFGGAAEASVPVARLVDGEYIAPAAQPVRLWSLEFEREEVIYAGGLEMTIPAPDPAAI